MNLPIAVGFIASGIICGILAERYTAPARAAAVTAQPVVCVMPGSPISARYLRETLR